MVIGEPEHQAVLFEPSVLHRQSLQEQLKTIHPRLSTGTDLRSAFATCNISYLSLTSSTIVPMIRFALSGTVFTVKSLIGDMTPGWT